jgi:hypothetical protein
VGYGLTIKRDEDALQYDHAEGADTIVGADEELQAVSDQWLAVGGLRLKLLKYSLITG